MPFFKTLQDLEETARAIPGTLIWPPITVYVLFRQATPPDETGDAHVRKLGILHNPARVRGHATSA